MNRLQYIWMDRRYLTGRRAEQLLRWVVWKLPRRLVMWCYIRVAANATVGIYSDTVVPELTMMEALKRWDDPDRIKKETERRTQQI